MGSKVAARFHIQDAAKIRARRALPVWVSYMARPELLELAWQTIVDERPQHVLELGSGMSTLVMAYALETAGGGDLIALEDHASIASNTRERLAEHELAEYAQVLHAPLQPLKLEDESHRFYSLKGCLKVGALTWYSLMVLVPSLIPNSLSGDAALAQGAGGQRRNPGGRSWISAWPMTADRSALAVGLPGIAEGRSIVDHWTWRAAAQSTDKRCRLIRALQESSISRCCLSCD